MNLVNQVSLFTFYQRADEIQTSKATCPKLLSESKTKSKTLNFFGI